jgi:hypothetical protein
MAKQSESHRKAWQRSPAIMVVLAVAVIAAVALGVYVTQTPYLRGDDAVFEGERGIRPAGSGTVPDGAADTEQGGLTDGTTADEAVDQTIDADNVPALLQHEGGDPVPEPSAEGLEPIDGEGGAILPEIGSETEMRVPGAEEDQAGTE